MPWLKVSWPNALPRIDAETTALHTEAKLAAGVRRR